MMLTWIRSWFVKQASPHVAEAERWRDIYRKGSRLPFPVDLERDELAKLREQNRQLIAENERRSAEVAWMRSMLDRLVSPACDEAFTKLLHAHSPIRQPYPPCNDIAATATLQRRDADPSSSTIAAAPVD